ncbi:MAG TPA: histidinol-phosphate transaminase [Dissulfurispiraceae bacterium]|nr:histidinol-phosphate transaminase [Dissulfurispiraceae bacterium]
MIDWYRVPPLALDELKEYSMIKPLECVSRIKPYVPGKPVKELERELGIKECIKLASNENPAGPSPKAIAALRKCLDKAHELCRYPDGSGYYLKNALSQKLSAGGHKVATDEIMLGNGSNELLDIAIRTFVDAGDEAVMATPSFVVYSMGVQSAGGIAIEIPLRDYVHNLSAMADAINKKTRMVFIANPNNPTGTINRKAEFEAFMRRVPDGVLIVMDEAYFEYVRDPEYPDSLSFFADGRDILILRTFSKAYGLASLRIGYGIAKKEILEEMNKIREPFNTNALAQEAALAALSDEDHLKRSIAINEEGKKYLSKELDDLGLRYVPTEANFIYITLGSDSRGLFETLLRKGLIIRPVGPEQIRVTIGLPEENKRFIEALKSSL